VSQGRAYELASFLGLDFVLSVGCGVWTGGAAIGYAFGIATRLLLKYQHRVSGHAAPQQLALTLGMAYLCFYLANGPGAQPPPLRATPKPFPIHHPLLPGQCSFVRR
jgi:hypothetical protein